MANQYIVNVGNIGNAWQGTNGAEALRQYGQWKAASMADHGRASGEPVTLFRNDEPWRSHSGHVLYCFRLGDGNEGNYPRALVRVSNDVCPFAYLSAIVANRYIARSKTRRYIVANIETDGEPEYGINATIYEGPKGEQASGAAWITAEFEPCSMADYSSLPYFQNPADHLDRSALRMLRKG
jgi:hypothetical protein